MPEPSLLLLVLNRLFSGALCRLVATSAKKLLITFLHTTLRSPIRDVYPIPHHIAIMPLLSLTPINAEMIVFVLSHCGRIKALKLTKTRAVRFEMGKPS